MALAPALRALIARLPKVELHLHIEGTLEPEMVFELAARHGLTLPYPSAAALRAAYDFSDLQSFLDIYYAGCSVLRDADDFHAMARAYLRRAAADQVRHAEIFFDPQSHTSRGVPIATVMAGLGRAQAEALAEDGLTSGLILCFLRHLSEDEAMATLEAAIPHLGQLVAVGLDSSERGHPPARFTRVFARARALGLRTVAHAGEEGPPEYISQALDLLAVSRIDHGVRCMEDEAVVDRLVREQVALTVCPLSNVKLRVFDTMARHNLKAMLDRGLLVTVNSDDPAYFGGYIGANFEAVCEALPLTAADLLKLAENAVAAAFVPAARQAELIAEIREAALA
jgi:adenosine deaminase